ncbi:hypothetical protein KE027_004622, partial [Citrobacter freundii]|nr:hypothetical protein [Citrobacter freundii]
MKSYLIENYANLQGLIGISFMFLMLAIIFISYVINGYNYKIIAKAYENKFGLLPQTARLARGASLIGTPAAY